MSLTKKPKYKSDHSVVRKAKKRKPTHFTTIEFASARALRQWREQFVEEADNATFLRKETNRKAAIKMLTDGESDHSVVRKAKKWKPTDFIALELAFPEEMRCWKAQFIGKADNADDGPAKSLCFVAHEYKMERKWLFFKEVSCVRCGTKLPKALWHYEGEV